MSATTLTRLEGLLDREQGALPERPKRPKKTSLGGAEDRLIELEQSLDYGFSIIAGKFDRQDKRFDELRARLDRQDAHVDRDQAKIKNSIRTRLHIPLVEVKCLDSSKTKYITPEHFPSTVGRFCELTLDETAGLLASYEYDLYPFWGDDDDGSKPHYTSLRDAVRACPELAQRALAEAIGLNHEQVKKEFEFRQRRLREPKSNTLGKRGTAELFTAVDQSKSSKSESWPSEKVVWADGRLESDHDQTRYTLKDIRGNSRRSSEGESPTESLSSTTKERVQTKSKANVDIGKSEAEQESSPGTRKKRIKSVGHDE